MVRARGLASEHDWLLPGEVRFARASTGGNTFYLRYRGVVDGLNRRNDYESYPTAMRDGDTIKMWLCGGPGDKIYYASSDSPYRRFSVHGNFTPVLRQSPSGPDSDLICDPSVVKVPYPPPHNNAYFMFYTATPSIDGGNGAFGAHSMDGIQWAKMDPRSRTFHQAYPFITPLRDRGDTYGVGQSSAIWLGAPFAGMGPGILHYFTDTSVPGPCLGIHTEGGWRFDRIMSPIQLGNYTWDFKLKDDRIVGFVAFFGDMYVACDGRKRRRGAIGITVSRDGRSFSPEVHVPMHWLTTDIDRQSLNNGGLLGTPEGYIHGDRTVFYTSAGYQHNSEDPADWTYGRWPPLDWDIVAIDVIIR
jgi:hypothetical protein